MSVPIVIAVAVKQDANRMAYLRELRDLAQKHGQPMPAEARQVAVGKSLVAGEETVVGKTVAVLEAEVHEETSTVAISIPLSQIPRHQDATHLVIWVQKTPKP